MNALRQLGLEARVMSAASVIERNLVQTPAGRRIAQNIHRAVLHRILLEAMPPASLLIGTRCSAFDDSTAILETGERIKADILVGADGISSVIRDGLHRAEAPRYAGYTCWRGVCQDNGVLPDRSALLVIGAGSQFGVWPCGAGQLYWFLTKNAPRGTRQAKAEAVALCRDWAAPRSVLDDQQKQSNLDPESALYSGRRVFRLNFWPGERK